MTTPSGDASTEASTPTGVLAGSLTDMNVIAESVVGYRRTLIAGGVSEEFADRMAEAFHAVLLQAAQHAVGLK